MTVVPKLSIKNNMPQTSKILSIENLGKKLCEKISRKVRHVLSCLSVVVCRYFFNFKTFSKIYLFASKCLLTVDFFHLQLHFLLLINRLSIIFIDIDVQTAHHGTPKILIKLRETGHDAYAQLIAECILILTALDIRAISYYVWNVM